jgi:inositol phosphorylceramide synthase catalytic subunit
MTEAGSPPPSPLGPGARLWRHMRELWPRWTLLPVMPFWLFFAFVIVKGDVRWDHIAMVIFVPVIAYATPATKRLCVGSYPMMLTALLYNLMGYVKNVGVSPERVHDCDLRAAELALFGFTSDGVKMTPNDWFLTHHATWLDLYCAVPYGTFIFACLGVAIYLYFKDYRAVQRFAWVFFLMNVAGFITYHVFPAAPPWYFHAHGCEISMTALPSAGPRLEHVDEVLGISYFRGMYGRSSDLYGAVPSLHVAYPLLIVVEGWRSFTWPARIASIILFVSMVFSAVYLDHHWVIDVVLGFIYCLTATALVRFAFSKRYG